jgi:hypothetical protein
MKRFLITSAVLAAGIATGAASLSADAYDEYAQEDAALCWLQAGYGENADAVGAYAAPGLSGSFELYASQGFNGLLIEQSGDFTAGSQPAELAWIETGAPGQRIDFASLWNVRNNEPGTTIITSGANAGELEAELSIYDASGRLICRTEDIRQD